MPLQVGRALKGCERQNWVLLGAGGSQPLWDEAEPTSGTMIETSMKWSFVSHELPSTGSSCCWDITHYGNFPWMKLQDYSYRWCWAQSQAWYCVVQYFPMALWTISYMKGLMGVLWALKPAGVQPNTHSLTIVLSALYKVGKLDAHTNTIEIMHMMGVQPNAAMYSTNCWLSCPSGWQGEFLQCRGSGTVDGAEPEQGHLP